MRDAAVASLQRKRPVATLTDPDETYGGAATYFQSISDLTNKHYRFRSLIAPSDVFSTFMDTIFLKASQFGLLSELINTLSRVGAET